MKMHEWEAQAIETADQIRAAEAAGREDDAEALRTYIWDLYRQVDRHPDGTIVRPQHAAQWTQKV